MLIDDYIEYHNKYRIIYNKSVVLMQVGSFFEYYGYENEGTNVQEICELLDFQMTRKKKSNPIVDRLNPNMGGLPIYMIEKYIDILVQNNYTVILVEQVTPPPEPQREVTRIISTATNIQTTSPANQNNFLMSLFFSQCKTRNDGNYLVTILSYVDINTNEVFIVENIEEDSSINLEETVKNVNNIYPAEIVVFSDVSEGHFDIIDKIVQEFPSNICIHNKIRSSINNNFFKFSYQNTLLNKVFSNTGLLSVIEYLDLENKPLTIICFVYLIQFCFEHSDTILSGLRKPKILEKSHNLCLVNNALQNLNIISRTSHEKNNSILNLLNNCQTGMGKRFFKQSLINPLVNVNEIKKRYDFCDYFIKNDLFSVIRKEHITNICDVERLYKRMIMKSLQPCEFVNMYASLHALQKLCIFLDKNNFEKKLFLDTDSLVKFLQTYKSIFIMNELEKVNVNQITKNIFVEGFSSEIDDLSCQLELSHNFFDNLLFCLNEGNPLGDFKLEISKDEIRSIIVTKLRYETLCKNKNRCQVINKLLQQKCFISFDEIKTQALSVNNKTQLKLSSKIMHENQNNLLDIQREFRERISELYINEISCCYEKYGNLIENCIEFVTLIDFYTTNAKNAVEFCYVKPVVRESTYSFMIAKKIRHNLIERIQSHTKYIANDISLGINDINGILLYGINSSGKSALMKSVGINVILAQCGMYVASESFEYSPYDHIFSRVVSGDNIFKNQSTFVAEISEIRTILNRTTNRSLILGDEILSSTETSSAIGIVTSVLHSLSNNQSSFIFATHLHELCEIPLIQNTSNIHIYHLSVSFDTKTKTLVYDRRLTKGQGSKFYGLEVARSLDLPKDVLFLANQIRRDFLHREKLIVKPRQSRYNHLVFLDVCAICQDEKPADEIHHIIPQNLATKDGLLVDHQIHKNHLSNLIPLCSKCHDKVHANQLTIHGFLQTFQGIKLDYNTPV